MEHVSIARVALAAATYAIDRPYDYQIPQELEGRAAPGVRVIVPFGAGNRRTEGLILALTDETRLEKKIKAVLTVLDDAPVLGADGIKLALWVRDRFFCTVYDAARAMLPAGLWFSIQDSYRVAEGVDRERSYDAAGRSRPCTADSGSDLGCRRLRRIGTDQSGFGDQRIQIQRSANSPSRGYWSWRPAPPAAWGTRPNR